MGPVIRLMGRERLIKAIKPSWWFVFIEFTQLINLDLIASLILMKACQATLI
jgi:hypothetical protein